MGRHCQSALPICGPRGVAAATSFGVVSFGVVSFVLVLLLGQAVLAQETPTDDTSDEEPEAGEYWREFEEPPSQHYNGTFIGAGVGPSFGVLDQGSAFGGGIEAYGRMGMLINLVDLHLGYRFAHFADVDRLGLSEGDPGRDDSGTVDRHDLAFSLRLHPLFVAITRADFLSIVQASFYLEVGVGLAVDTSRADEVSRTRARGAARLGVGLDIPLGIPDGPSSWWISTRYARHWTLPVAGGLEERPLFHEHLFTVAIDFRLHNLRFARAPRPHQLDFETR